MLSEAKSHLLGKKLLVVLVLVVFSSLVFAEDAIYLKSGKILKGKITVEGGDSISIEMEDEWKEINRKDIKKIERDKEEEETGTKSTKKKSKAISTIKLGLSLSGSQEIDVGTEVGDADVNMGIGIAGETVWPVNDNLGLGFGSAIEFECSLEYAGYSTDASFMHWPTYFIFQVSDYKKKGISPFEVLQLGFNIFFANDLYKGPGGKTDSLGFHLGFGGGKTSKKKGFQAELLYAIDTGSLDTGYAITTTEYYWVNGGQILHMAPLLPV